jgi:hypothetical protein
LHQLPQPFYDTYGAETGKAMILLFGQLQCQLQLMWWLTRVVRRAPQVQIPGRAAAYQTQPSANWAMEALA